jgi:nitrogen-specific signal transduction histidine kinase
MNEPIDLSSSAHPGARSCIAALLLVGIGDRRLVTLLEEYGYRVLEAGGVDEIASVEEPYALMIVHQDLVAATFIEKLYFLNNRTPIAVLITDPCRAAPGLLSILHTGALECFYDHEISSGLIRNRIDRMYISAQLDRNLEQLQKDHYEREHLKKELSLRSHLLEHERELNANIVDSITTGLAILDTSGIVITINDQGRKLLKLGEKAYAGAPHASVFPAAISALIDSAAASIGSHRSSPIVKRLKTGDVHLEVYCDILLDYSKNPSGILLFFHDITEQEHLTQQLYRAEKLSTIGTMLSGIAHELRNPLAIISARAERGIDKRGAPPEWYAKSFDSIERQTERCITIINDLLDLTRSRYGGNAYHQVAEIINEALGYCTYQKNFQNLKIEKKFQDDLSVYGDRSRFMQAFLNIIMNAIEAMNERGTLGITTRSSGGTTAHIEIRDSGCGIDQKIAAKIFDPFFTTKDPGKGTGLGLSIVYKIIQESGGKIWFASRPGSTTWHIDLPQAGDSTP